MNSGNVSSLVIPPVDWHEQDERAHVVQLYSSHEFLANSVGRYIATALAGAGSAVVIATESHEAAIRTNLLRSGLDVDSSALATRCMFLNAADTLAKFMIGDLPDRTRFLPLMGSTIESARQASGKAARVVAFGEMVALLRDQGNTDAAIQLEQLWNELSLTHSFSLRCAYPIESFDQEHHVDEFLTICDTHSSVIPGESYSNLDSTEKRLRNIGYLQHRAQALEREKRERSHAENSLRLCEAELTAMLENAPEGVVRVGPDQKICWANRAVLDLLRCASEECVGHPFSEFYVRRNDFSPFWRKLISGEEVRNFSAELRSRDGSVKHAMIHAHAVWQQGKLIEGRCFVRDMTEQRSAEMALRDSEARLRNTKDELEHIVQRRTLALRRLSSQVLGLQDAERRRIARELHDSLGQYLAVLKLNLEMLRDNTSNHELWAESEKLTERCISEMRTLSYLLHPPMIDEAGLASAARWYIDGFGERSGTKVGLDAAEDFGRLPGHVEVALFRILQEALTNAYKHAKASAIAVRMVREASRVILEIKDDGQGISPEVLERFAETGTGAGVGLTGMRERVCELGGQLSLQSTERGTAVQVSVPAPHPL